VAWPWLTSSEERRHWSSLPASPLLDEPTTSEDQPRRSFCDGAVWAVEPLCLEDAEDPGSMLEVQAPTTPYVLDTPSPQLQYINDGSAGNEAFERAAWEARCRMLGIMPSRPDHTGSDDDGTAATSSDAHEEATIEGEPFVLRTPSPLYRRSECWAWIQEQEGRDGNSPPMRFDDLLRAEGLADYCSSETPSTARSNYSCTSSTSSSHGTLETTSGSSAEAPGTIVLSLACMV
jgi:hypothetical protein